MNPGNSHTMVAKFISQKTFPGPFPCACLQAMEAQVTNGEIPVFKEMVNERTVTDLRKP